MNRVNPLKLFKSKKAISPILATLLLIVIAVAAIIVTYAWIMTYMQSGTQQAGELIAEENIRFYGEPTIAHNRTEITVRNTGTSDAIITTLYIGLSKADTNVTIYTNIASGIVIAKNGGTATITLTWPNSLQNQWQSGITYYFKIATQVRTYEFSEPAQAA